MDDYTRYITRTVDHIHRVQKNMVVVTTEFREKLKLTREECRFLMFQVMNHDRSKFDTIQFIPYIELTKFHHERKVLGNKDYKYPSEAIEYDAERAIEDHYCKENHHPERMNKRNHRCYDNFDAIETVCDLQAMAEEFNEGTCRKFFEEVWKPKQKKNFRTEINWEATIYTMDEVIKCFESKLKEIKRD